MKYLDLGNVARKKAVFIGLLAALILSAGSAAAESVVVRVPAQARAQVSAAEVRPTLALDYGSFQWLEVKAEDLDRLTARGVPFTVVPDARQVRVPGFSFDPLLDGEPKLLPGPRAEASRPGFRLVQLVGPVKEDWLSRLAATGARVLQYYPHNTYLVWAAPAASEAVESLDFVRWQGLFHPAYKVNSDLQERHGKIANVDVMFFEDDDHKATLTALTQLGAEILQVNPSQPDKAFYDAIIRLDAGAVDAVAALGTVLWLGYESPRPILDDEMSDQIQAGNHPGGTPVTGYLSHLSTLGVDGTGVTWAVVDTGVDYNHPDLGSHIVGGFSFPGIPAGCDTGSTPGADCAGGGHGTHVAGIIGGDATGAFTDANGFLFGLGVAPEYGIFAMNSLSAPSWPPAGGWQEHSKRAVLGGAIGGNSSWTTGEGAAHGYQASERTHDLMVRDGNFDTAGTAEPYIAVFSAGNSGPGPNTLTSPKEAKNLIVTASSQNFRIGSIDTISSFSSRGPAVDGRIVPTITAPGEQISSTRNDLGGDCSTAIGGTNNLYAFCSGTSMASPHASGAVVLLTDWWRGFHAGANPSPAMAKALLVNGAVDMGTADIPNANEGWGRINVSRVITPAAPVEYWDQTTLLAGTGQDFQVTVGVPNPGLPVKVSLAWTDAAGAVGANPALVNNLDLRVVDGANTYMGNRFTGGTSVTGGTADTRNNLENVFIQSPGGSIDITVAATAINGDGVPNNGDPTDQDFALVCSNCALTPDFTLGATPASLNVCAPANAVYTVPVGSILSFTDPVTLSASGNPAGTTVGFSPNPVTPPGSSTLTVSNTGAAAAGSYTLQIDGTSTTGTKSRTVGLNLFTATPAAVNLLTPADAAGNTPVQPTFTWQAVTAGGTYTIEIANDPGFTSIVETASGLTTTSYTLGATLNTSSTYYWRVRAGNACGTGSFSAVRSFTTVPGPGDCGPGTTPVQLFTETFEAGAAGWTHSGTGDTWALSGVRVHSGVSSFNSTHPAAVTDQFLVSPPVALPSGALPLSMKFWNHQTIEDRTGGCFDAAVLEISTNGGGAWTRLEAQLLTDPYNGPVSNCCSNPVNPTNAWCGDPQDWTLSIVDISAFQGQTVNFRFRSATDTSVGREGWYVDDVSVQACTGAIFNDGFESGNLSAWSAFLP
ncbi:MAG TPA: S8 family serine peptidase [Thermoanaerobaculia bacterium]|nr:S8 family serine peptidase [Thermoanaerobaculia bacterium]